MLSDDVCSEDLSDTRSSGERCHYDDIPSSDEDADGQPLWDTNPELRWEVWQIDDFTLVEESDPATGATKFEYFVGVPWDWRRTPDSTRYRTMEPLNSMLETHRVECWLAMRFKDSGKRNFREFCKTDWFGQALIAASDDYSCTFKALKVAAEYLRRPNLVPQHVIDAFFEEGLRKFRVDLSQGCTWKQFAAFLGKLAKSGTALKVNEMIKNNYACGGRRGAKVLQDLKPEDGVVDGIYLVGAYNRTFVGHDVVLIVAEDGKKKTILDQDREMTLAECDWMRFFSFIRLFRVW